MELWYVKPEWWLCIIGAVTFLIVGWQACATARAAKATEASVEISKDHAMRELRAYLAVVIGDAVYQERDKNLLFEGRPLLINSGRTPAHKIRFKARAAILPVPLPKETDLPETGDLGIGETILSVQQTGSMCAVVDGFCQDDEVEAIKSGNKGKALYVWGRIDYVDIFDESHYTRFCHQLHWDGKGTVRGFYVAGRNDSD